MTAVVTPDPLLRSRVLRERLRPAAGPLATNPIGTVPILWNNVDVEELRLGTDAETILDDIARTGYDGTQFGLGFPEGQALREALAARDLRLAEVYAGIPATADGPGDDALALARRRLEILVAAGGEVLCVAIDGSDERSRVAGRASADATARFTDEGWSGLVELLHALGRETEAAGARMAFHPHAGTFVETPEEVATLMAATDPSLVPLCLDVGHYIVGGGDPIEALDRYGERVTHIHVKDVDPDALDRLRDGGFDGFDEAIAYRLFTELGAGALDLAGVLRRLARQAYGGWLMVEQDSSWGPPSEAAAIGRRVLARALADLGREGAT